MSRVNEIIDGLKSDFQARIDSLGTTKSEFEAKVAQLDELAQAIEADKQSPPPEDAQLSEALETIENLKLQLGQKDAEADQKVADAITALKADLSAKYEEAHAAEVAAEAGFAELLK